MGREVQGAKSKVYDERRATRRVTNFRHMWFRASNSVVDARPRESNFVFSLLIA